MSVWVTVSTAASVAFDVSSIGSMTLTFEGTTNGDSWRSILVTNTATGLTSTTTTANGTFNAPNAGFLRMRLRATSYSSGTATITATQGYLSTKNLSPNVTSVTADIFCLSSTTQDSYLQELGANNVGFFSGGTKCASGTSRFDYNGTRVNLSVPLTINTAGGATLIDDAANTLAQRNGTNPQLFRTYRTFTDTSNGEWLDVGVNPGAVGSTIFGVVANSNGAGVARQLTLGTFGLSPIDFLINDTNVWQITTVGNLTDLGSHTFLAGGRIASGGLVSAGLVGVPNVTGVGAAGSTVNTGVVSIATYTVGAADGDFEVSATCLVTVSTTHSFSLDVVYTDTSNVSRTMILPVAALAGAFITGGLITNVTGTGNYESAVMHISAKAGTVITIRTSAGGTFTTVTYFPRAVIKQMA